MNVNNLVCRLFVWRLPVAIGLICCVLQLGGCGRSIAEDGASEEWAAVSADELGGFDAARGILFWEPEQQVVGYRNIDRLFPTRTVHAGDSAYPLRPSTDRVLDSAGITYQVDVAEHALDEYLSSKQVAGLLVVRDGEILLEHYALGNDENSRWISFSIAKSVVSMLIGAAILDGYIESVEEPITKYLPQLAGGGYDGVSIENVLQMASGVDWNEDYADPDSDVANTPGGLGLLRYMSKLERIHEPGTEFNYNTGETNLAGALLRSAIGNNLATYLENKIWGPFGMEHDASWLLGTPGGGERGGCCISATLRDYARIGLFAMSDGVLADGTRVLPEGWMAESTRPSQGSEGYGYLWWLRDDGAYAGIGIFGQLIYIHPEKKIVIVTHSAWPTAVGRELSQHRWAVVEALVAATDG